MGSRAGTGIEIDLQYVPQRETGMSPYEIMLSESQERMLLVAEKGREDEVFAVFRKWGLDAATIGVVTATACSGSRIAAKSSPKFRTGRWPTRRRCTTVRTRRRCALHPLEAPAVPLATISRRTCCASSVRATSAPSAGFGSSTITWSGPTPSARSRRRCGSGSHQRDGDVGRHVARWQRTVLLLSIPGKVRS